MAYGLYRCGPIRAMCMCSLLLIMCFLFPATGTAAPPCGDRMAYPPVYRVFAADNGLYYAAVSHDRAAQGIAGAVIELYQVQALTGKTSRLWRCRVPYVPGRVIVNDEHAVCLINEWGRESEARSLAFVSSAGMVLREYSVDEIVPAQDILENIQEELCRNDWFAGAMRCTSDNVLTIRVRWGLTIRFNWKNGSRL